MHIPDEFLSKGVALSMDLVSGAILVFSIKVIRRQFDRAKMLFAASIAALIFALQMLNFPIAEGTSGHFMGSALAAILFGPAAAMIVLTVVLVIQCFVFGDGGVLALGANIFNMGVIGVFAGYYTYNWLKRLFTGMSGLLFNVFISSWISLILASGSCAVMLGISGTGPTLSVVMSMVSIHMVIGVGEGIIALVIIGLIYRFTPVLTDEKVPICMQPVIKPCSVIYVLALAVALFLSPYACPFLDGLERVAEDHGFLYLAEGKGILYVIIPDYVFPGIKSKSIATSLAGFTGTIITAVFFFLSVCILTFGQFKGDK
ncbi:MAG: energy-coupling factor ABC transporter permease [Thermodesulfovibrionales bacterium]|nr:energy-coupling factor ABC transporter permease [Thermodesulfovibrionales bacterium]